MKNNVINIEDYRRIRYIKLMKRKVKRIIIKLNLWR